jgi:hypothetical protein
MNPLSHHEILALIAPFARRGRRVDLASSDRAARRVAFVSVEHPGRESGAPMLREQLELESREDGLYRLVRRVMLPDGPVATLGAEGPDAGTLLAGIDAIPVARQVASCLGHPLTFDHELEPGAGQPESRLRFVRAVAQVDGFRLVVDLPSTERGVAAKVELFLPRADAAEIPQDLLAVLGWRWTRLDTFGGLWRGELRLGGRGLERARLAEAEVVKAVQHLALTFTEPPARFHERQFAARWRVTLRRAVPLLVCGLLVAGAIAVPKLKLEQDAAFRMLVFNAPPLLLILLFCLPELPRIEIPPIPRRLTAATWRGQEG